MMMNEIVSYLCSKKPVMGISDDDDDDESDDADE